MVFTTKDQDNDLRTTANCVEERPGGWWFNNCHYSHLNGLRHENSDSNQEETSGVNWYHWKGYYYSLKATEMKISVLN